jgi:predicted site-specific integrase-resolvase
MAVNYVGLKEAAAILGVKKHTLMDWDRTGKVKASRHPVNNRRMFREDELNILAERIKNPEKPK